MVTHIPMDTSYTYVWATSDWDSVILRSNHIEVFGEQIGDLIKELYPKAEIQYEPHGAPNRMIIVCRDYKASPPYEYLWRDVAGDLVALLVDMGFRFININDGETWSVHMEKRS